MYTTIVYYYIYYDCVIDAYISLGLHKYTILSMSRPCGCLSQSQLEESAGDSSSETKVDRWSAHPGSWWLL